MSSFLAVHKRPSNRFLQMLIFALGGVKSTLHRFMPHRRGIFRAAKLKR